AALAAGDSAAVAAALFNRLEAPAHALHPRLEALQDELAQRPEVLGVLLSGSGSTVLCLAPDAECAAALAARLRAEGRDALATRTISATPHPPEG
ncbi:MAG: 4-(cytidine 5'-diphospho)-2-C-methyl-D-erythritol kinase, partial [Planctomycetota bacterium]